MWSASPSSRTADHRCPSSTPIIHRHSNVAYTTNYSFSCYYIGNGGSSNSPLNEGFQGYDRGWDAVTRYRLPYLGPYGTRTESTTRGRMSRLATAMPSG